ncbi:MAG: CotH kinase family protein [Ignavibacteriae bacterium]|nr:CotH kinase family protein [Ignavibacteriota bacterium]
MNKKILTLFCLFSVSLFAQNNFVDHWESIIYANDTWSYYVGDSEPPADWKLLTFDDTDWQKGEGGIGYGDNDDNTIIPETISLFTRIKFNVSDTSLIEKAILSVDYDDGFVAYLNGIEIARAGISGTSPTFNQLADLNHDANIPTGGRPDDFFISSGKIDSCLALGENILAIQVHNVTSNSSDLSSTTYFSVGVSSPIQLYREVPEWFTAPFEFTSSNIPILIIDTQGETIVDEPKIMAKMGIINNQNGINSISDSLNEYDGWIGIENRGNASARISDKKPYTIETRNEDGSNRNVEILGLPKENDFVLRAGYMDKTLMRDALAYSMYRNMGRWAPRTRHVELILNGSYQGVYVLEEKIKPDKNRLDIAKMDSSDIEGEALTGGYVWCTNRRWGDEEHNDLVFDTTEADGNARFLRYPKPSDVMPEQLIYISKYEQEFCDIMNSPYYNAVDNGYNKYINLDSFIDEMIIQELTSNSDAYGYSGYFHKDRGKKISAGPEWDFDQALCNSDYNDGGRYDEWIVTKPSGANPPFWIKLFNDEEVHNLIKERWSGLRKNVLTNDNIFAYIDSVVIYLNQAQQHNFNRWPILGVPIWRSLPGAEQRDTYQKEVDFMKEWLGNHLSWMDAQLKITTAVLNNNAELVNEFKLYQNYPNPFNPSTSISFNIATTGLVKLNIYDSIGKLVKTLVNDKNAAGNYSVMWNGKDNSGNNVSNGVYYYRLSFSNSQSSWQQSKKMILLK